MIDCTINSAGVQHRIRRVFDVLLIRFLTIGLLNTLIGVGAIFILRQFVNEFFANGIAFALLLPFSFLTHGRLSFRHRKVGLSRFMRYVATIGIGYMCNLAVLMLSVSLGINGYLAQLSAIVTYLIVTFFLSRFFVFQR